MEIIRTDALWFRPDTSPLVFHKPPMSDKEWEYQTYFSQKILNQLTTLRQVCLIQNNNAVTTTSSYFIQRKLKTGINPVDKLRICHEMGIVHSPAINHICGAYPQG